jgi:GNAT superfamily N-acetyltransferase
MAHSSAAVAIQVVNTQNGYKPPDEQDSIMTSISDMSHQARHELIQQADLHTRTVQAWLASRSPSGVHFEGLGVKVSSTGIQVPLLNLALGCDYSNDVDETMIDAEIERTKDFFAQRGVPWYWWIGPNSHPSDFEQFLVRQGVKFDRSLLPAMAATLPTRFPTLQPEIRVWQASTLQDLQAASTIRRIAFRFPAGIAPDYFEAMAEDWLSGNPARLYLARHGEDQPAAIGALILGAGVAGIYVMATLPEMSRKGLGKAILSRLLKEAENIGHKLVILTASQFGYPLYQQFGFEHIFDYKIYQIANPTRRNLLTQ